MDDNVRAAAERVLIQVEIHTKDYGEDDQMTNDLGLLARYVLASDHEARTVETLRAALRTTLPIVRRTGHDHPTCTCRGCDATRAVRAALAAAPGAADGAGEGER